MQFHYLNRHKSCPQYIGDRPIGFVLFSEKKGETVHDFLRIPLLLFVVSGKLKIISNTKQETIIADNQMVAAICEEGYTLEAMADTLCLRLYVMGDGLNFCHRIVSFPKDMESDGTGKVLTMVPEVKTIVRQMVGYITDGVLCCDIHALKQQELAAVLQGYYKTDDLRDFVAPIYDPHVQFYNEVQKIGKEYPTVSEMAEHLNMSYSSFVRHFRKVFKENPQEWIAENRLRRMLEQLRNTPRTEQDIADELGFSSLQIMRAFCKTKVGKTPSQIRQEK